MKRRLGTLFLCMSDWIWEVGYDKEWDRHYIITGEMRKRSLFTRVCENLSVWFYDIGKGLHL